MPHQCTECGHAFADGSKEMLSGCPECGGTKFQFHPKGTPVPDAPPSDATPPDAEGGGVAETVGRATTTVRSWVHGQGDRSNPLDSPGTTDRSERETLAESAIEDAAQASARREVASPEELPDPPAREVDDEPPGEGQAVREPTGEHPDLSELREELNDQFESIKILEPGQYELNLMELYDREEYIIALQENGRYVIQMPEDWIGRDD
ncbi:Zn-ribbon containing protein [Halomarina halobia]|uniref:Zn-ribbon containing protein n=1 Tax=Halomarina halobia TaxID=3033386 RepID=A0ABD6AAS4_9EURY|nr:Zn-ribbon containing protein [Halomarina sp. PSR21]